MNPNTVLKSTNSDVKRLALAAREAFFLSQLDGSMTIREAAECIGVALDEAIAYGERLVSLGAALETRPPEIIRSGKYMKRKTVDRIVEKLASMRPRDPRMEERAASSIPPVNKRKSSRKSLRAAAPVAPPPELCSLDEETLSRVLMLDAKLGSMDLYSLLEIERGADKKAIKRGYFKQAATYHPDRFFNRPLGNARKPIERIFHRMTEAQDILLDADRRAAYDATLPKLPTPPPPPKAPSKRPTPPPRRRSTKSLRRVSLPKQAAAAAPAPPPPTKPDPAIEEANTRRIQKLREAAKEIKVQANIDLLVTSADEALAAGDVVKAANDLRLALSYRADPHLQAKYEKIDARSKTLRFDRDVTAGEGAERQERWNTAAAMFTRAFEARADAAIAARAANAIRRAAGDLEQAKKLALRAVDMDRRNVHHRMILIEVLIESRAWENAREAIDEALEVAPKDARLKELASKLKSLE